MSLLFQIKKIPYLINFFQSLQKKQKKKKTKVTNVSSKRFYCLISLYRLCLLFMNMRYTEPFLVLDS